MADSLRNILSDDSTRKTFVERGLAALSFVLILLAFIFCLAKGSENNMNYVLAVNMLISSGVGVGVDFTLREKWEPFWNEYVTNAFFTSKTGQEITLLYRNGDLGTDKFYFIIFVGCVLIIQSITTDIYVFHGRVNTTLTNATVH